MEAGRLQLDSESSEGKNNMAAIVLVCDDEDVLRALVRATLTGSGYSLVEAADGDESLRLARELRPDLIVLDMMMPGRSGLEILAEIRQEAAPLGSTPAREHRSRIARPRPSSGPTAFSRSRSAPESFCPR